jgi:putative hydrolase of the HAD superfamily
MNKTKAVFLDVGWTLLYPRESIWEIFASLSWEAGAELTAIGAERLVHAMVHGSRDRMIAQLESGAEYTDSDAEFAAVFMAMGHAIFRAAGVVGEYDLLLTRFFERFWRIDNWAVFPDVLEGLERLRAGGVRLGVLSNASSELTLFLQALGLLESFDFAVVSAVEGIKKPDRRIFERAVERAGVGANEAVHVGDMFVEDVMGARGAGLRPLFMDRGKRGLFPNHPEVSTHEPGSLEVVRNMQDVLAALDVG